MNVNPVGITKIIPKEELKSLPYKDLIDMGCTEVRERFFNDGSRILIGYNNTQKIANFTQKLSPLNHIERAAFYNIDFYGPKKKLKEVSSDKVWYNKIGDVLKSKYLVKNYENDKLVKEQKIKFDIIEGLDESRTKYTSYNTDEKYKNIGLVHKHRISEAEYIEDTYSKNGDLLYKESHTINDKDGMWKF